MNKIADLRSHLFETLDALRGQKPMDIDRAKAIADVAQVIVNSAKVENDFIKRTGSKGSGFIAPQLSAGDGVERIVRQIPAAVTGNGHLDSNRCPDPNCGGLLRPQTNGNGGLKDVCDKCRRSVKTA